MRLFSDSATESHGPLARPDDSHCLLTPSKSLEAFPVKRLLLCFAVVSLACQGCGSGKVPVSGIVTYPDGTPFTQGGKVVFETGEGLDSFMLRSELLADGTYDTGKEGGLVPGVYKVCLSPAVPDSIDVPLEGSIDANGNQVILDLPPNAPLPRSQGNTGRPRAECDTRFLKFETSGLTVDVKAGVMTFDIQVDKPPTE